MTPAEFAEVVVVPTVRDFLANRGDRRRAYLACITTYHLVDHIAFAENPASPPKNDVRDKVRATAGPSFAIVQGVCNGTKHPESRSASAFPAGREAIVDMSKVEMAPSVPVGTTVVTNWRASLPPGPQLAVPHIVGLWTIDFCVQTVLRAFVTTYPQHLGTADFNFLFPLPADA